MASAVDTQSSPVSSTSTLSEDPSTLSAINAQLLSHGWIKRPLNLNALKDTDYSEVVTVLFDLLGSNLTNLDNIDALSARHRNLNYEHERLQKSANSTKATNARLHTEVEGWKARCADLEKKLMHEEVKVKELREEVGRGKKALDSVRVAAVHESKKSQTRMDKAQLQLMKLSNEAGSASRSSGLVILNPIHPGRGVPIAPNQSPLLEQTIKDLVEIRAQLQEETEAFRHVLISTGSLLNDVLAEARGEEQPKRLMHSQIFSVTCNTNGRPPRSMSQTYTHQTASSASHPALADAHLKSLVEQVRAVLHAPPPVRTTTNEGDSTELTDEEREEKKRVEREAGRILAHLEEKVKDLEVEVSCAKAREDEAKKLVEEYARVHAETRAAQVIGDEGDIEKQRNDLEAERKAFSEATQRLGEERRRLEGERRALLEEKKRWQGDFMADSISPLVKPKDTAVASSHVPRPAVEASSSTSSSSRQAGSSAIPPPSPWRHFQPSSPSPLSPSHHKVRSPRTHVAGGGKRKAPKTPLSRLVLEKAVLHRDKSAAATATASGSVFGTESTRRANVVVPDKVRGRGSGDLKASTADKLGQSVGPGKKDLTTSQGVGPKAVALKASKAWR